MTGPTIGIDLGTTFFCAGIYRGHKGVEIIPNEDGDRIFPSIVYYSPTTGQALVGKNAFEEIPECQRNGLYDAKRIIGRKFDDEYVSKFVNSNEVPFIVGQDENGQAIFQVLIEDAIVTKTPEQVSAEILRYIKQYSSAYLNSEVTEAVISVPAYFSNAQRNATKNAAELAGLNVLKLITEPTAAAIHYLSNKEKENINILVFDFGGGTLDVSIIEVSDKRFEVKAVHGDTFLGGRNIDEILFGHFEESLTNISEVNDSRKRIFHRRLRNACVDLKKRLSIRSEAKIAIPSFTGGDEDFFLCTSRSEFDNLINDICVRTLEVVKICLSDSDFSKAEIDEVILVGGTSRIPKIREILGSYFGIEKLKTDIHPDEAIAAGASIQAALLKEKLEDLERYKITEVTPLSLGIELNGNLMDVLIPKNSHLPFKSQREVTTSVNEQECASITIFEGERKNTSYNNLLGEFYVYGFPKKRAGKVKVIITFELDQDGVLNVTAFEKSTGANNKLSVTMGQFHLSEKKIAISLEEAERLKDEDDIFEKFITRRNALETDCFNLLYDLKKISTEMQLGLIEKYCNDFLIFANKLHFSEIDKLEEKFAVYNKLVTTMLENNLES